MGRRKSRLTSGSPWPAAAAGEAPVTPGSEPAFAFGSAVVAGEPPPAPRLAFIVSHTHWDREWYLTFSRFRVRLLDIVGQVLETLERDGAFRHFMLDGQAAVLGDYLEIRPEDAGRVHALVQAGRLSIGPWYVLPDWFLVSGEAIVRNLLVGHQACAPFGPVQKVGYMPDSFGHTAQIPQILRRAGIDSFIYTRGNGDETDRHGLEFLWQAPDGSEVLAVNQHRGYDNAAGLGFETYWEAHTRRDVDLALAVERVRGIFEGMAPRTNGDIWLLNNGGDHLPPQQEFGAVLTALRQAFPRTEFRHTGLAEFVRAVREAGIAKKSYSGELRWGKDQFILPGVWSARTYLKQANDEAQTLLERYLEPVFADAHFRLGAPYPSGAIGYAWKLLLRNHPHDSICGCSTDEVHREMVPRFSGVIETAEQLIADHLVSLAPTFARTAAGDRSTVLCVMNPLPERRSAVVERLVVLPPPGADVSRLELVDAQGRPVPCHVTRADYVERFWGIDYRTELRGERQLGLFTSYRETFGKRILRSARERARRDQYVALQFVATDLPALGHATYHLRERPTADGGWLTADGAVPTADGRRLTASGDVLENALLHVRLQPNGTFDVTHKATGRSFAGLNALESTEDIGDEYDYSPAPRTETYASAGSSGAVRVVDAGPLVARLEAAFEVRLPAGIRPDRKGRLRRRVSCPVRVQLTLRADEPFVEVVTTFENRARDHRLRALFPLGIATDTIVSDGHFYVNRRPIAEPEAKDWLQPPSGTHPQQEFSLLDDAAGGLALLNRGLPEIAAVGGGAAGAGGVGLALTLLRAVGWLSRDDFPTRSCRNAGPTVATPDAQCLGARTFRYAVLPFAGGFLGAGVPAWSRRWRTPPVAVQGVEDGLVPGGAGLLEVTGPAVAVSAIKKHEVRDTLVVRLCNLAPVAAEAVLVTGPALGAAWRTDLLEERLAPLAPAGAHCLAIPLGPHEIATVEVEFALRAAPDVAFQAIAASRRPVRRVGKPGARREPLSDQKAPAGESDS